MKTCTKCNQTKPFSEFHKDSQKKDGFYPHCKECRNARQREYDRKQSTNLKVQERKRKYRHQYRRNPDIKERERQYSRDYLRDNPDKASVRSKRRRARKAKAAIGYEPSKEELLAKTGGLCYVCDEMLTVETVTQDHIVPLSAKGSIHSIENLMPMCRSCNSSKSSKTLDEFLYGNRASF